MKSKFKIVNPVPKPKRTMLSKDEYLIQKIRHTLEINFISTLNRCSFNYTREMLVDTNIPVFINVVVDNQYIIERNSFIYEIDSNRQLVYCYEIVKDTLDGIRITTKTKKILIHIFKFAQIN